MPPKRAAGSKKASAGGTRAFDDRKAQIMEEVEERMERMTQVIEAGRHTNVEAMLKAISQLDPAILSMTLGDFFKLPPKPKVPSASSQDATVEAARENTTRAVRETTVDHGRSMPLNEIQQTAVRPQKGNRVLELRTPAGKAFQCPSLITPRVGGGSLEPRAIRRDEVAFSAAGSPIVMGEAEGESVMDQLTMLMNSDVTTLTPTSRSVVQNLREMIERKRGGAEVKMEVGDEV